MVSPRRWRDLDLQTTLPLPAIMSCFPTVSERDRNGRRAAKLEGETERKESETARGGVAVMEGYEEIRGRESTAEM